MVEFEACGPAELLEHEYESFAKSPNLGRLLFDSTQIIIVEIKGAPCTLIYVADHRYMVWGEYDVVRCRIMPDLPDCKER